MNEKTPQSPAQVRKGCGILAVAGILVFLVIRFGCSSGTEAKAKPLHSKQDAVVQSHLFVDRQLKSPGSADYPYQDDKTIETLNDSSFVVLSYVDSQNGFGALMRTYYKCKVIFLPNGTAKCEDLVLEQQ